MIHLISQRKICKHISSVSSYYYDIIEWLENDKGHDGKYHIVAISYYTLYSSNEKMMNEREKYDLDSLGEHAYIINYIIHELKINKWLAKLGRGKWPWFGGVKAYPNRQRMEYINSLHGASRVNIKTFNGGVYFDVPPVVFINMFIDYSYINNRYDIDIISCEEPVLIKLSHHLSVDIITSNNAIYKKVIKMCSCLPIKLINENPHVYVNPEVNADQYYGLPNQSANS
jgi:hypothetical protein